MTIANDYSIKRLILLCFYHSTRSQT